MGSIGLGSNVLATIVITAIFVKLNILNMATKLKGHDVRNFLTNECVSNFVSFDDKRTYIGFNLLNYSFQK